MDVPIIRHTLADEGFIHILGVSQMKSNLHNENLLSFYISGCTHYIIATSLEKFTNHGNSKGEFTYHERILQFILITERYFLKYLYSTHLIFMGSIPYQTSI